MLEIHYFASIREALGLEKEFIENVEGLNTVANVIDSLIAVHGEEWHKILKDDSVLVSINQEVAKLSSEVKNGDEIAFFPPVTGG